MTRIKWAVLMFAGLAFGARAQQGGPCADSIYACLRHLAETIGPRPMGSPAERAALDWVRATFVRFGADSAYLMPFAKVPEARSNLNTTSGNAIGLFRGEVDSLLVVGGHIDSSSPEVPGANDNASGTATVVELARVWSQRHRRYGMLFVAFGGEERGLLGSTYFVNHFAELGKVKLMLSLDMSGARGPIVPMFETKKAQAPAWLVRDAFAIDAKLGHHLLRYPTHFSIVNSLANGAGSEHEPILTRGIPSIAFTVGMNTSPIHTPHDKVDFIERSTLGPYARFVDELLTHYQRTGVPGSKTGRFMLWQVNNLPIFVPWWAVVGAMAIALALAPVALLVERRRRLHVPRRQRARLFSLKLLVLWVAVVLCAQAGEALLQWLLGFRHPWVTHVWAYVGYAGLWALLGLWLSLQSTRLWRFSADAYLYARGALILLTLMTGGLLLVSGRLAFYPAVSLLLMAMGILLPAQPLSALCCVAAPLPLFRLLLMETLPMGARILAQSAYAVDSFWRSLVVTALLTVILAGWLLPVIYILAYSARAFRWVSRAVRIARSPAFGGLLLVAVAVYGAVLSRLPAYDAIWRPFVRVTAECRLPQGKSMLRVASDEYMHGFKLQVDSLRRDYRRRVHKDSLAVPFHADWIELQGGQTLRTGVADTLEIDWRLLSTPVPYNVTIRLRADSGRIDTVASELAFRKGKKEVSFAWSAWPEFPVPVNATVVVNGAGRLVREVTATYTEMPVPVVVESPSAHVLLRTKISLEDTLHLGSISGNTRE